MSWELLSGPLRITTSVRCSIRSMVRQRYLQRDPWISLEEGGDHRQQQQPPDREVGAHPDFSARDLSFSDRSLDFVQIGEQPYTSVVKQPTFGCELKPSVERLTSRAPSLVSSRPTSLLIAEGVMRSSRAAAEKPPSSKTRAKKLDRFAAAWRAACQGGSTIWSTVCQAKARGLRGYKPGRYPTV
jgi:hypothetical protein